MPVWKLSPNECRTLDLSNPDELLRYAKKLVGHSFREVLMLGISPDDSPMKDYGVIGRKVCPILTSNPCSEPEYQRFKYHGGF